MAEKVDEKEEPLVSEAHSSLFHYTTETGLYGILESQELWATHFAYLNDSQEIIAAKGAIEAALYESIYQVAKDLVEKEKLDLKGKLTVEDICSGESVRFVDALYKATLKYVTPYIFSFCSHGESNREFHDGLLSQWRGYGSDGGFAIEFDSKEIEEQMHDDGLTCSHSGFHVSSVVYGTDSREFDDLKGRLDAIASVAGQMMPRLFGLEGEEPAIDSTYLPFVQCITRMKNPGFREEGEVRLVYIRPEDSTVPVEKPDGKEIGFRAGPGVRTPYVQIFKNVDKKLPIARIVVGPHPKAELRGTTLKLFLSQNGIDAEVVLSSLPYLPE